jgi:hypothetical protein
MGRRQVQPDFGRGRAPRFSSPARVDEVEPLRRSIPIDHHGRPWPGRDRSRAPSFEPSSAFIGKAERCPVIAGWWKAKQPSSNRGRNWTARFGRWSEPGLVPVFPRKRPVLAVRRTWRGGSVLPNFANALLKGACDDCMLICTGSFAGPTPKIVLFSALARITSGRSNPQVSAKLHKKEM